MYKLTVNFTERFYHSRAKKILKSEEHGEVREWGESMAREGFWYKLTENERVYVTPDDIHSVYYEEAED